ncbi:MAG TPA: LamG-like jellyroll fold domain-containing protein [Candidatus Limnocylindrales bacterium]
MSRVSRRLAASTALLPLLTTFVWTAAPATAQCPAAQPDPAAALASARACGSRVEVMSSRSGTTQIFAEADGSSTAEVHTGVVRIKDASGAWRDVDLSLERRLDGSIGSRVHPVGLTLAAASGPGDHDLAVLGSGAEQVAVGWRGTLPEPVLNGTKATYANAKPGVDLVVEVTRTGFESFLVVKNKEAAAQVASVEAPWRSGSLTPRTTPDGEIDLVDGAGKVRGQMSKAYMWDATIDPRSGEPARKVPVGVTAAGPELRLTTDAGFFADPATVYPVTIDPQWDIWARGGHHDTWVQSDGTSGWNSTELKLGTYNGGATVARSFIFFDMRPFYGTYINWATLHMYETWAYSCRDAEWQLWTTGYADHTTRWNSQPPWVAGHHSSWETTGYDSCEGNGWVNINARDHFQAGADAGYEYYNLGLRAGPEWHSDTWKRFLSSNASSGDPFVTINFHYAPTVTALGTTPSTPCVTGSGRPRLSTIPQLSAVLSDPEGASTWAQFEWWVTGGSAPIGSAATGPAGSGAWQPSVTIPASDLPDGGTFSWRARGHDGAKWSGWSGWCEFTLDSQPATQMVTSLPSPCMFTPGVTDTGPLPRLNPANAGAGLTLKARVDDINGGATRAEFEWWAKNGPMIGSVITPAPGLASGSTFTTTIPAGTFAEGQPYSWRARGHDGGFAKPWSQWCEFVVDTSPPGVPTVTADPGNDLALASWGVTPPNPSSTAVVGRPTQVRFRPSGGTDPNVVAYLWGLNSAAPDRWAPAGPDGTAVVTVTVEPLVAGFTVNRLTVMAVDRAGNRSALPAGQDYSYGFKAHPAAGWWATTGTAGPVPNVVGTGAALALSTGATLAYGTMSLTGSSSQAATTGPVLNTTGSYSVSAWVRPAGLTGDRVVVSQDGVSENGFRLLSRGSTWCFGAPATDIAAPVYHEVCAGTAVNGVWAHLAGVHNPATQTLTLYVNGVAAGSATFPTPWAATGPFAVGRGRASGAAAGRFTGDIADIRAWQRIMDPAGIAALAKLPPSAGRWGMDDPASTIATDLSGLTADHDATLSGPAAWAPGRSGYGLRTIGTGSALTASGPAIRTDGSFTVSAWVNSSATTPWHYHAVSQDGASASAFMLGEAGGQWTFTRAPADASSSSIRALATTPIARNTWTHLTGVYDAPAGQIRLYVNGVLAGTAACACSWHASGPFVVGRARWNGTPTDWWPGTVDDVRVFTGVLSAGQIANLATL